MEPKQEERKKPSRAELEARVARFRELMGDKLRDHKDGDAEEYLFRTMKKRSGSHANH